MLTVACQTDRVDAASQTSKAMQFRTAANEPHNLEIAAGLQLEKGQRATVRSWNRPPASCEPDQAEAQHLCEIPIQMQPSRTDGLSAIAQAG